MKRLMIGLLVLMPTLVSAQSAGPASLFVWDQPAPDLVTAQSYTYRYYADGASTGTVIVATCTGTAPIVCTIPVPAFTPGGHTIQFTASNVAGESAKSAAFPFTFVIVPGAPFNIRIQ